MLQSAEVNRGKMLPYILRERPVTCVGTNTRPVLCSYIFIGKYFTPGQRNNSSRSIFGMQGLTQAAMKTCSSMLLDLKVGTNARSVVGRGVYSSVY